MGLEENYTQTGAPVSGNHATQAREIDHDYNFIMGLMQRQFNSAISAGMAGYAYSQAWSSGMGVTVTGQGIPSHGTQDRQSVSNGVPTSFRILEGQTKDHWKYSDYEYQAYKANGKPSYSSAYQVHEQMTEKYRSRTIPRFDDGGAKWKTLDHGKWSDRVGFTAGVPRMGLAIYEQRFYIRPLGDHGSGTLMSTHFLHMSNACQGTPNNVVVDMGSNGY